MNSITIKPVHTRSELLAFVRMVWGLYKSDPNWVPPLLIDRLKVLNREKNPFFQHAEAEYFLAYRGTEIVGRIAAITNKAHNDFHKDKTGFFGFLESIDDPAVFEALLNTAKVWLKERGKDTMIGPMNPSTNDEIGFLLSGFDSPPYFMMTHTPPYYIQIMEKLGYEKVKDVYAYYIDRKTLVINDKLRQISESTKAKLGVKLRPIRMDDFDAELARVRTIYNNAWAKNWGFVPMTAEEIDFVAADFKKIIDPQLVLIGEIDNKPIGFLLAMPNYNEVFAKIKNGKLFPIGWLKFLLNRKKIKSIRVITLGVIQKFHQSGIGGLFYLDIIERGLKAGYQCAEMSWVLEDNDLMNRAANLLGGAPYKTYRLYGTSL